MVLLETDGLLARWLTECTRSDWVVRFDRRISQACAPGREEVYAGRLGYPLGGHAGPVEGHTAVPQADERIVAKDHVVQHVDVQ